MLGPDGGSRTGLLVVRREEMRLALVRRLDIGGEFKYKATECFDITPSAAAAAFHGPDCSSSGRFCNQRWNGDAVDPKSPRGVDE